MIFDGACRTPDSRLEVVCFSFPPDNLRRNLPRSSFKVKKFSISYKFVSASLVLLELDLTPARLLHYGFPLSLRGFRR